MIGQLVRPGKAKPFRTACYDPDGGPSVVAGLFLGVHNRGVNLLSLRNADRSRNAPQRRHTGALAVVILAVAPLATAAAPADDVSTRFVEQLRAEGHADLVPEYLERAANDPLVSDAFKKQIPYQLLASKLNAAEALRDPAERAAALAAIEPELRKQAAGDDNTKSLLTDVTDRLAVAAADEARRLALEAERHPVASERADKRKEARAALDDARQKLSAAESLISGERGRLKGSPTGSDEDDRWKTLGDRLALVRLLNARLIHEKAQTFPEGAPERKQLNEQAAEELGALYEKYSKFIVGLYAHLYEGRCYRQLGERQLAAGALEDLTAQPAPTPDLRKVVTLAHAELAALALDNGDADKALDKPAEWLEGLAADEKQGVEAAALRYRLGLAALAKAGDDDSAAAKKLRRDARDWLGESARVPSEVQADARAQWVAVSTTLGLENPDPKTFDEAIAAGREAIQTMLALDLSLKEVEGAEAATLQDQRKAAYDGAYSAMTAAVKLADEKTDPAQAAQARYQLAWLDWDGGDAAKAASRAAIVAQHDKETDSGEQAARLALAALERLEREGTADASARLQKMAEFVLKQWPNSEVAESASSVLVASALRSGDLQAAERVLETVPETQRRELALRLAIVRWEQAKSDPAKAPPVLLAMRQAFDQAVKDDEPTQLAVTAALYLADAALDAGDITQAETLLNHQGYGPVARLNKNEAPADSPPFALATLKSAIRVASLTGKDAAPLVEKYATTLADAPAETTGGDRSWLGLAVGLLGDIESADNTSIKAQVAATLAAVLERLDAVEASGDWNTRLWIAQARLRVGELLADKAAAKASVAAGRDALAGLIEQAEQQPGYAPSPTSVLAARLKLAECQRTLGDYANAVDTLTAMIDGGPVLLDVQRVAAETLQAWGEATKDAKRLEESIAGARPGADGKNLIWGWSKLAAVTGRYVASDPGKREVYFDAWRRVAEARYQAAMLASGAERTEQLRKAASTLIAVERKNPELGGPESKRAYDELLRKVQANLPKAGG
ncbi:hypothetical protein [Botrimarina mediterranea]|uniref:Tetratricopeptide repeat protein n=1 Tax=Botrimarina mediterranea TaxID=2528022 RepID=A0A518KBX3_9BACT|nr:hypothetical protein [Botrimarina mediterranea]QDV75275.1 hypothetical protein Spa11_34890 [Botrimarina mediterranea]